MTEYEINIKFFPIPYKICNKINQIHLNCLNTTNNVILSLFDLNSKILPEDTLHIYPNDIHTWVNNTGILKLDEWILHSKALIYASMENAQSDGTYPFWSKYKQTPNYTA